MELHADRRRCRTTAPVMMVKDGRFIAQSMVHYTPVKSSVLVDVSKALAIQGRYDVVPQTEVKPCAQAGMEDFNQRNCLTTVTLRNSKSGEVTVLLDLSIMGQFNIAGCRVKGGEASAPTDIKPKVEESSSSGSKLQFEVPIAGLSEKELKVSSIIYERKKAIRGLQ